MNNFENREKLSVYLPDIIIFDSEYRLVWMTDSSMKYFPEDAELQPEVTTLSTVISPQNLKTISVLKKSCDQYSYCEPQLINMNGFEVEFSLEKICNKGAGLYRMQLKPVHSQSLCGDKDKYKTLTSAQNSNPNALFDSQQRLQLALDAGQLGIWDWNIETNAVVYNPRWAEMLGYQPHEVPPTVDSFFGLLHPEDVEIMSKLVSEHLNGNTSFFEAELRMMGADGEYKWIYDRGMVVSRDKNGKALRAAGIHVYIHDNKKASQALSESEQRFRNIFRYNSIGIVITDPKGKILDVNPKVIEILGYTSDELKGMLPIMFSHPDDIPEEKRRSAEMFSNGSDFFQMEKRYIRKDGSIIWAHFSLTLIRDENNGIQMAIGLLEDISEKKEAEEQLKKQNLALLKMNEELNNFVYRTSHDLRSPLTSLMGLVNIIENEEKHSERANYLKLMLNQLSYLDGVIREIIDYRKIAAGETTVSQICLKSKVEEIMDRLQFLPNYELIDKQISAKEEVPFYSDDTKVNIILNNLLSNAIKYSDKTKASPYIHIHIHTTKTMTMIEFTDNGIGIKDEYLPDIFKMFFRATSKQNGTGLGLYIVKEALEKLNGSITVSSSLNEETCFKVLIPNQFPG
ncbi:MAG: PAS domain S-box protein [Bacteroidia bacterium]|nr:PAS domain S-box protein [Bacteroidia bacterium]